MTIMADPSELGGDTIGEIPLVVGVALDHGRRERLANLLEGVGVVMFTRDVATAHVMLGRQLMLEQADPAENASRPVEPDPGLKIDRARHRVTWRGVPLGINRRERDLLACLAIEPIRVWTYRQLYESVWDGRYLDPGPVHAAIKRLRRKLRHAEVTLQINALRGVGYELTGPLG